MSLLRPGNTLSTQVHAPTQNVPTETRQHPIHSGTCSHTECPYWDQATPYPLRYMLPHRMSLLRPGNTLSTQVHAPTQNVPTETRQHPIHSGTCSHTECPYWDQATPYPLRYMLPHRMSLLRPDNTLSTQVHAPTQNVPTETRHHPIHSGTCSHTECPYWDQATPYPLRHTLPHRMPLLRPGNTLSTQLRAPTQNAPTETMCCKTTHLRPLSIHRIHKSPWFT